MWSTLAALLPAAFGIVLSPLAVVAVVAVLTSPRGRSSSIAYLVGWVVGIAGSFGVAFFVLRALQIHRPSRQPGWVGALHLVLGLVLVAGAVWVLRRQRSRVRAMAAASTPTQVVQAAPQLPGWLHAVEHFTPTRSGLLGCGLFILNPIDLSCAIAAALELALGSAPGPTQLVVAVVFVVLSSSSVLVPVAIVVVRGPAATPFVTAMRTWIAGHTSLLNALLLALIGALQLIKALQSL